MKNKIQIFLSLFVVFWSISNSFAQETTEKNPDADLQESLYKKYKNEVRAYNRKNFDDLFIAFFDKSSTKEITLTKEEYYTYTIKIAIYSEKLGLLYKNQKEEALKAKQDWFDKKYSDYLNNKK